MELREKNDPDLEEIADYVAERLPALHHSNGVRLRPD